MSYEDILYEIEDRVATITINRPEAMNACTLDTYREIEDAFREARDDDEVRVVVLTGSGRAFCAGDDVKAIFLANQEQQDKDLLHRRLLAQLETLRTHARDGRDDLMIHYPKPTIAMVNGVASVVSPASGLRRTAILQMGKSATIASTRSSITMATAAS